MCQFHTDISTSFTLYLLSLYYLLLKIGNLQLFYFGKNLSVYIVAFYRIEYKFKKKIKQIYNLLLKAVELIFIKQLVVWRTPKEKDELINIKYLVIYCIKILYVVTLPLKSSVTEDGLTTESNNKKLFLWNWYTYNPTSS